MRYSERIVLVLLSVFLLAVSSRKKEKPIQIESENFHWLERLFHYFYESSSEAAVSNLYGGFYYPSVIEKGLSFGHFIKDKIQLKSDK